MSSSGVDDDEAELTRKQRREQARAQRKALEEAEAASAKRRTRLTQLGIVAAIVVAIVVVILIATGGGGSSKPVKSGSKVANENVAVVDSLVGGIPQHGNTLGDPNAPVTLQYFGDLECPICKEFTLGALPLDHPEVGPHRQGQDRIPLDADRHARTGSVQNAADRGATPRASRIWHGTSSSSSTTSRAKRTAATSPKATCRAWPSRCPGWT